MAKIQPVWAIDIGQAAIKALKLIPAEEPEKLLAEAFDYIEYPKILSQPDADPEELVREALATFIERNDVVGSRIALGVSGQAGLVKFIKLPPVEKKRIPDIVKFEARQQIPFALEEVIWDYQQIVGDDEDEDDGFSMAEVGLFAMKRDQINRAILPLKNAGIEVDIVQMGPIALYNFAAFDQKQAKDETGSIVYVDIGADNSDLIITDGVRIWQRNVPIGGNHFTRALTKELKLTFAKAEHLKRNATKAPDPRAVFTAMRGVFNDFSSEISRSIGFYSSVNRTAKIAKVVGLGNGFKLPGLQKFLQQNLSYEVEKLESFEKLVGDEVVMAPQFVENLPSFAIAYGLAAQGMGKAPMKTNLLPPEIQQVRLIRRKKPWALAASTLLMLGFTTMFVSDWSAWANATSADFKSANAAATSATEAGNTMKTQYTKAKTDFDAQKASGTALVAEAGAGAGWPALLRVISQTLPDPAKDYALDPNDPKNYDFLAQHQVYVDRIVPAWRSDVAANWFDDPEAVNAEAKKFMHVYDRTNPPTGEGWIIQVVGHHFNPTYVPGKMTAKERETSFGPTGFLQKIVLPRFWRPNRRAFGINHATVTWMPPIDREWTTEKSIGASVLAPMLGPEATAEAASGGAGGGGGRGFGGGSMAAGGGGGAMSGYNPNKGGSGGSMSAGARTGGMNGLMGKMGSRGGGSRGVAKADKDPDLKTLTRTDFKLEFVWQPPKEGEPSKDTAEYLKAMAEAEAKSKGAVTVTVDEKAMEDASLEKSAQLVEQLNAEMEAGGAAAPAAGTPPVAPPSPGGDQPPK